MKTTEEIQSFFESSLNAPITEWVNLPQSGSARKNFIATSHHQKYVVTYNENTKENNVFLYFSNLFSEQDANTPKIFAVSDDELVYIQEFLGENTLSEVIANESLTPRVAILVQKALDQLYSLQIKTQGRIDYQRTFEYESYDQLPVLNDLFYFKNFMVDILELQYHKASLLKEFMEIVSIVEALQPRGLMIRDFQARNIMVNNDDVFFIDYQGAMEGPLMYDVISFLFQAKANFPQEFKKEMIDYYISKFQNHEDQVQLKKSVKWLQLMRFLQVLGAYGFRGLIQKKQHFIQSIDQGIINLAELLDSWDEANNFPQLKSLVEQLQQPQIQNKIYIFTQ